MTAHDYDLFVIGGGSGGVRAARVAAAHGARVGIAEEYRFGGTCVIRGCVPKKLLVYASRFADEFAEAAGFGWQLGERQFDWPALIAAKDREIARLEDIYAGNLEKAGVVLHRSRASFEDAEHLQLAAEARRISARRILIATGGRPYVEPSLPGVEHCISSNEIFDLRALPGRVVVIGGGYVALEFACLLHGLGAEVTVVYRGGELLRGFDDDLRRGLREAMQARGIRIALGRLPVRVERDGDRRTVTLDDGTRLDAGQVLLAIGRVPNTGSLGLDRAGVALGRNGAVRVDADSRSSVAHIFAVGDVTDRVNLTPAAIREGQAFADSEFGGKPTRVDHALVPTAVFTTPELGSVGLTEGQARTQCPQLEVYRSEFRPLKSTLGGGREKTLMKLLVDGRTRRVLGAHMLGPGAGEMIQLLAIPIRLGATKEDFDATLAVHPTAAEEWVTMARPVG